MFSRAWRSHREMAWVVFCVPSIQEGFCIIDSRSIGITAVPIRISGGGARVRRSPSRKGCAPILQQGWSAAERRRSNLLVQPAGDLLQRRTKRYGRNDRGEQWTN